MLALVGCGATAPPPPEEEPSDPAPAAVEPAVATVEEPGAVDPEPQPTAAPEVEGSDDRVRPRAGGPSITGGSSRGGSCGEEAERECQMRGGNCSLVADSPCVGRGSRCQDWEMEMSSGCRCYCEPTDAEGRPVLPR